LENTCIFFGLKCSFHTNKYVVFKKNKPFIQINMLIFIKNMTFNQYMLALTIKYAFFINILVSFYEKCNFY